MMRVYFLCRKSLFLSFFIFIFYFSPFQAQSQGTVSTITDQLILPGAPEGRISDGVLMRPQGKNQIQMISYSPTVSWLKIEQSDFVTPLAGPNPNRTLFDGNPATATTNTFNLTDIQSVRFTVTVRGDRPIPQAVFFRWIP